MRTTSGTKLSEGYDTLLAPATTTGKNVLPRVAALLDVMQVSEITEVVSADTFKRPIYAGNAIEVVQSTEAKKVLTILMRLGQAGKAKHLRILRKRCILKVKDDRIHCEGTRLVQRPLLRAGDVKYRAIGPQREIHAFLRRAIILRQ